MPAKLFPYDTIRKEQDKLVVAIEQAVTKGERLIAHAPTGLGKTAAALAPAIEQALASGRIVIFLTSRLTQHALALDTVEQIGARHGIRIPVVDLIGKKHMCLQENVAMLSGKEFADYCRNMREDGLCEFYERLRQGEQLSPATRSALVQLGKRAGSRPEEVKAVCAQHEHRICPYEATMMLAREAKVVITDYSYLFNERIRDGFFHRINKTLSDCILIVDEGHNLPDRVKDLATERITASVVRRAVRELEKLQRTDHVHHVKELGELLARMAEKVREERHATREELLEGIARICPIDSLVAELAQAAVLVREEQKASSCGTLADFLEAWQGPDEGFTRILSTSREAAGGQAAAQAEGPVQATLFGAGTLVQEPSVVPSLPLQGRAWQLSYRCLDPSVITRPALEGAYSAVVMSGTLTPVAMYAELLGVPDAKLISLKSPFPDENRLNLVIPKTTTKFATRSPRMYEEIARACADVAREVPGNLAIFFPSYAIMQEVKQVLDPLVEKTVFSEHSSLTREEREELLDRFRSRRDPGAILLGVMGGSFSEGIDLPGDELRAVLIVGLPLGRPDLETQALIDYYQKKFGKGWEYGYTFPAFNKTLQSAGRCIRTETDKGAILFLDERYAWETYYRCFPSEWNVRVTLKHADLVREFFSREATHGRA